MVSALPAKAETPAVKKVIMSSMYGSMGNWDILTPQQIVDAGFQLVTTPTFTVDDQTYCIKTKKLTLWMPPENLERFMSGDKAGCQAAAIKEIKALSRGFSVHSIICLTSWDVGRSSGVNSRSPRTVFASIHRTFSGYWPFSIPKSH